jgi:hypothetical protein
MLVPSKRVVTLYVDRANLQWVARDSEGRFWSLPSAENPSDERQPFTPAEETELEPVPAHYEHMLGLPP